MTKDLPAFDLSGFLPYLASEAAERLSAEFAARYRAKFGLSRAEWRVLAHVADAGAVSVRDIHARARVEKSKASRAATRLEAAGYLKKEVNDRDRRLVSLSLTVNGHALMAELLPLAVAYQSEIEARLGSNAQDLAEILRRLGGEDAEQAAPNAVPPECDQKNA